MLLNHNRVCCISDIHIGVHQNSSRWHDILMTWAHWLKTELVKKDIKDIVISGDFFHYRDEISVNTMYVASQVLDLWSNFNIVMLVGNHDAYYKERSDVNSLTMLKGRPNIRVIDTVETHECFGKKLTFVPWATPVHEIPESDIIFGHFEIQSFRMTSFKVCDTGMSAKDLLKKCPLIITGHFHLRDEREYKDGKILYLGNPFQMDFGDRETTKGYYLLDVTDREYSFYNNDVSPSHKKIRLSELIEFGDITDDVRSMFKNNIIRLIIDKNITPDDVDTLLRVLLSLNTISLTVEYENTYNNLKLLEGERADLSGVDMVTAIKEFIELLDIDDKSDIVNQTVELYNRCK